MGVDRHEDHPVRSRRFAPRPGKRATVAWRPIIPTPSPRNAQPNHSDTGRFLAAGARHSYWVRTATGRLEEALPSVCEVRNHSRNLIVESNSLVELLAPDLYLVVLDFAQTDFKASSRRLLSRADACVLVDRGAGSRRTGPVWHTSLAG